MFRVLLMFSGAALIVIAVALLISSLAGVIVEPCSSRSGCGEPGA